jgi:hypothetical protein
MVVSLRGGTGPHAPTRGCPSDSTARRRRNWLDPDDEPQAERLERSFELLELRAMGHRQQAVDLRQMARDGGSHGLAPYEAIQRDGILHGPLS